MDKMTLAEMSHEWYLEAIKELSPKSYNSLANVPFEKLSDEQKHIDVYIARKVLQAVRNEALEEAAICAYNFCPETLGLNHKVAEAIRNLKLEPK